MKIFSEDVVFKQGSQNTFGAGLVMKTYMDSDSEEDDSDWEDSQDEKPAKVSLFLPSFLPSFFFLSFPLEEGKGRRQRNCNEECWKKERKKERKKVS